MDQQSTGIVVTGASGRMGRMLVAEVLASDACRLVGALERPGHDWIGRDLGEAMGGAPIGVTVSDDPVGTIARAQAPEPESPVRTGSRSSAGTESSSRSAGSSR